ncbi:MAG: division/cell wall cluster transcriptional repressor MraZ [Clostridiales bacterium]|nr:division/cell wall cluster transcriptional repressor MraZ [Clostridiales bacterium]
MLSGECQHNIDVKGRMIVPAKFREDLGEKFVITRGLDGCIFVYAMDAWIKLERKLVELPLADAHIQRFFIGGKEEVELDKQGRILIPAHLRTHARLTKDIVSVGVGGRVEIWDKAQWQLQGEKFTSAPGNENLTMRLDGLGI